MTYSSSTDGFRTRTAPRRISTMRLGILALLPLLALTRPGFNDYSLALALMEPIGAVLLIGAIFGRLWAIAQLSERENKVVVNDGPYAICRHPMYLFSLVMVMGAGLMLGSVVLSLICTYLAYRMLSTAAEIEERFLTDEFGETYRYYQSQTNRMYPRALPQNASPSVAVKLSALSGAFLDAFVLLCLIPLSMLFERLQTVGYLPSFPIY